MVILELYSLIYRLPPDPSNFSHKLLILFKNGTNFGVLCCLQLEETVALLKWMKKCISNGIWKLNMFLYSNDEVETK